MVRSAAIRPGKRAGSPACQPFRLQRKMTFAKVVSLCRCVAAFGVVVAACGVLWPPFPPLFLSFGPLERHPSFAFPPCLSLDACVPAGRHKDRRTGRQACRPFRLQRKGTFSKVVSLCRCVAAFGVVVAACGVLCPALLQLLLRLAGGNYLAFSPFQCLYACVPAGRHKGKQTGRQVNRQAGKNACHPARKNACRFVGLLVTNR